MSHCFVPTKMCDHFEADTQAEMNIGVAVKGHIPKGPVTLFKITGNLDYYFVDECEVIEDNSDLTNVCRTLVKVKAHKTFDYAEKGYGNNLMMVPGHYANMIKTFFEARGVLPIEDWKPINDESFYQIDSKRFTAYRNAPERIEVYPFKTKSYNSKIGSVLTYINSFTDERVSFRLTKTEFYTTYKEVIDKYGSKLAGYPTASYSKQESLLEWYSFCTIEEETKIGVEALFYEKINPLKNQE